MLLTNTTLSNHCDSLLLREPGTAGDPKTAKSQIATFECVHSTFRCYRG